MSGRDDKKKTSTSDGIKTYAQYSGMAFQLFALLLISMWIGMKLDEYFGNETYYIAAGMSVLALVAYLYNVVRVLGKKDNED